MASSPRRSTTWRERPSSTSSFTTTNRVSEGERTRLRADEGGDHRRLALLYNTNTKLGSDFEICSQDWRLRGGKRCMGQFLLVKHPPSFAHLCRNPTKNAMAKQKNLTPTNSPRDRSCFMKQHLLMEMPLCRTPHRLAER